MVGGLRTLDMALADTSVFIAVEQGRELRGELPSYLGVSVVTLAELRLGVLIAEPADASRRLDTLLRAQRHQPFAIDEEIAGMWADVRAAVRRAGRRIGRNDAWIAATAKAWRMPVVTQDTGYEGVPGLDVIRV